MAVPDHQGSQPPRDDMDHQVLLIADDPALATMIRGALVDATDFRLDVEWVRRLADGLERLRNEGTDAVLLDLFLPDGQGIETLDILHSAAPHLPILVVSDLNDEDLARQAIQRGAQDYLPISHIEERCLPRALRNAIERKAAEDTSMVERERTRVTLDSIGDAVLGVDVSGNVTYLNRVAERMTGWSREDASGHPLAEVFQTVDTTTHKPAHLPMKLDARSNETVGPPRKCVLLRRDGFLSAIEDFATPIHDRQGRLVGVTIVFHEVIDVRPTMLKMPHLAEHEFRTALPNPVLLNDRLGQAIARACCHGNQAAVLFLNLDRFTHVNDCLGRDIGDELLQSVAERLVSCVRDSDTVSRYGEDEFVVLLAQIERVEDVTVRAKKMLTALTMPHSIAGHTVHVTASVGISLYPRDGHDAETLVKSADIAMYSAKERGRNNYQFFKHDASTRAIEQRSLEGSLRGALERQEFVLHYQPKIDLRTGAITGAEALIRWQHPEQGLILPAQFIPIAEDCNLIVPMDQWAVYEACRQARAWRDADRPVPVAVNISAAELQDKCFFDDVRAILEDTRLEPRYLELELTESALMHSPDATAGVLDALNALGVQLAIDDFGTGYSSLSYLRKIPIDTLKIDQSFVRDITANPNDATVVSAVISLGHSLKRRVIAEGVETQEQLAFLQAERCREAQGYYFGRPMVAAKFAKLLETVSPGSGPN
jgi:diguanylate cyclase (GGDEF)-like protein/PAS domain S-box-containing protein